MRRRILLGILAVLLLVGALRVGVPAALSGGIPVYPVSIVALGLRQQPQAWIGRTVLIWGRDLDLGWPCSAGTGTAATGSCTHGNEEWLLPARRPFRRSGQAGWTRYPPAGGGWGSPGGLGWRPGLLVRHPAGIPLPAVSAPTSLVVHLAQLPVVGPLIPARLVERGALYEVRLLDPQRCAAPPCPGGVLL